MTKSELISDVILRLTRGKPSDDLEIEPSQVAFWIDLVLNGLVKQVLDDKIKKGIDSIDPAYICYDRLVPIKAGAQSYSDNFYVDLCAEPLNLFRDRGVIRVSTESTLTEVGEWVDKMKMEEIDNLKKLKFSKPSLKNLKYHRVKSRLYFYGFTNDTYQLVTLIIGYVPRTKALDDLGDDDPIYVGDEIPPLLAEELEKIGRRQISGQDDNENDSQDDVKA